MIPLGRAGSFRTRAPMRATSVRIGVIAIGLFVALLIAPRPNVEAVGLPAQEPGAGDTTSVADAAAHVFVEPTIRARFDAVEQLLAIYRRIPGLRDIRIEIDGGIVELSGTAFSPEDRDHAIEYARTIVPNVIFVDAHDLHVETDIRKRLAPAADRIREKANAFVRFLPSLATGLLLIGLGTAASIRLGKGRDPSERLTRSPFVRSLIRQTLRVVVFVVPLVLALDLMGISTLVGALLGAAGLAGIAIGFAFRDIVENYLAGILLSVRQPFRSNDHVQLAGEEGRVVRLTGRETILMTLDGNHVRIPNATVFKSVITNLSRNPRRRFVVSVSIAPWEDLGRVIPVTYDAVSSVTGVLVQPRPAVRVHEFLDSGILLRVSGWVDQTEADFGKVRSQVLRSLKERYEQKGIATPPPEYGVRILAADEDEAPEAPVPPTPTSAARPPEDRPPAHHPTEHTPDISPDTTIEDEIARDRIESKEEDLLEPEGESRGGPESEPDGTIDPSMSR